MSNLFENNGAGNGRPWHPMALMYNGTQNNPQLFKYQTYDTARFQESI
jgi:hypothetical protein